MSKKTENRSDQKKIKSLSSKLLDTKRLQYYFYYFRKIQKSLKLVVNNSKLTTGPNVKSVKNGEELITNLKRMSLLLVNLLDQTVKKSKKALKSILLYLLLDVDTIKNIFI